MTAKNAEQYSEDTRVNDHVEILDGPEPFEVSGRVVGVAQIQRVEVLDYKTKQPTGEKLVELFIQPSQGRAIRARLKYVVGALEALGFIAEPEPDPAPAPEAAKPPKEKKE